MHPVLEVRGVKVPKGNVLHVGSFSVFLSGLRSMQEYPWPDKVVPSKLLFLEEWDPFLQTYSYRWPLDLEVNLYFRLYYSPGTFMGQGRCPEAASNAVLCASPLLFLLTMDLRLTGCIGLDLQSCLLPVNCSYGLRRQVVQRSVALCRAAMPMTCRQVPISLTQRSHQACSPHLCSQAMSPTLDPVPMPASPSMHRSGIGQASTCHMLCACFAVGLLAPAMHWLSTRGTERCVCVDSAACSSPAEQAHTCTRPCRR